MKDVRNIFQTRKFQTNTENKALKGRIIRNPFKFDTEEEHCYKPIREEVY